MDSHQGLKSEFYYQTEIQQCAQSSARLKEARKGLIHHEKVSTKYFLKFKPYLFPIFWSILFVLKSKGTNKLSVLKTHL